MQVLTDNVEKLRDHIKVVTRGYSGNAWITSLFANKLPENLQEFLQQ